jgi:hypothetical protein
MQSFSKSALDLGIRSAISGGAFFPSLRRFLAMKAYGLQLQIMFTPVLKEHKEVRG